MSRKKSPTLPPRAANRSRPTFTHPSQLADYVLDHYASPRRETCGAVYLDARNRLLGEQELPLGPELDDTFDTSRILRQGLLLGATGILLYQVAADPSLFPTTPEHRLLAIRLSESSPVVGLRLRDFLVVAFDGRWASALHNSTGKLAAPRGPGERTMRRSRPGPPRTARGAEAAAD